MEEPRVTIYTPESRLISPIVMVKEMFRDLANCRKLAWRLTIRDLNAQYRQSYLGFLWAFILPLVNAMVWVILGYSGVINVSGSVLPYPVYVLTGIMLWAILMDALNAPFQNVSASKSMLAKINFPREALVIAGIYQTTVNALIKAAIMLVAILVMGIHPGWSLLLFPLAIFSLILTGTDIGLAITPISLLYADVTRIIQLGMQFMMYLTPVIFIKPKIGILATLFQFNPFTPLIVTAREWLTGLTPDYLGYFAAVNAIAIVLLFVFWIVFRRAMPILIERMGS